MPSGKMIAWIVALSLATTIGLDHYRAKQGASATPRVRAA